MNRAVSPALSAAPDKVDIVGAWPALIVVIAVIAGAFVAFAHRPGPPFPPTQVFPDRLLVNAVTQVGTHLLAAGEQGRILFATDPAGPWREARVEPQRGSTFTQMLALDERSALAVGHDGWIVRSTDRGETWQEVAFQLPAPVSAEAAAIPDPFASSESAGEGATAAAPTSDPLLGIAGPFDGKLFAFGAFGLFLKSADQGRSWTRETHESIGDGHLNAMARAADGSLIVVGERGLMARSRDAGASWQRLPEVYSGSFYGLLTLPSKELVAFGMRGNVFVSRDAGNSWQRASVPVEQSLFAGAVGPGGEVLLAGASNTVLLSTDRGARFRLASPKERNGIAALLPLGRDQWLTAGDGGLRVQQAVAAQ